MSEPPFAYSLAGCPHDCGWVGDINEAERVHKKEYSRDIYRCPECGGLMKHD